MRRGEEVSGSLFLVLGFYDDLKYLTQRRKDAKDKGEFRKVLIWQKNTSVIFPLCYYFLHGNQRREKRVPRGHF
jgi:hypothetical protein